MVRPGERRVNLGEIPGKTITVVICPAPPRESIHIILSLECCFLVVFGLGGRYVKEKNWDWLSLKGFTRVVSYNLQLDKITFQTFLMSFNFSQPVAG